MLSKTIIKYIQSLSHKKVRDQEGVFIAEGPKVVADLLSSKKFACKIICGTKAWLDENETLLVTLPQKDKHETSAIELEKISQLQTPNKVLAVLYKKAAQPVQCSHTVSVMLDDIQDPGNMGTIIRTADWFGIKNIICSNECVDCYNPKVVQATMGSLAGVHIIYTDLEKFLIENKNIKVYAATLHGKILTTVKTIKEGIILIGNESKGVKENLLHHAAEKITIEGKGQAESLNAAVAFGIIVSHLT